MHALLVARPWFLGQDWVLIRPVSGAYPNEITTARQCPCSKCCPLHQINVLESLHQRIDKLAIESIKFFCTTSNPWQWLIVHCGGDGGIKGEREQKKISCALASPVTHTIRTFFLFFVLPPECPPPIDLVTSARSLMWVTPGKNNCPFQ